MAASRLLRGEGRRPRLGRTIADGAPDATGPLVRLVLAVALAGMLCLGGAPARAAGDDTAYTARAVPVEASAGSATEARDAAVANGQVSAFGVLLRRITDPRDHDRLPDVPAETIRGMVETYSLSHERTTDTTYSARITVRYDGDAVRALLQRYGIGHVTSASEPILVVPVYQAGPDAAPLLWEDTNPWLAAWRRQDSGNVLMPMEVPTGDLTDVTSVTAEEALEPVSAALEKLVDRYGRARVLVAHAVRMGPDALAVSLNYGSPRAMASTGRSTVTRMPGESDDAFLVRIATSLASRMEEDWRAASMVRADSARQVTALVTLSGFGDWIAVRKALDRSPLVRSQTVRAVTRELAQVSLTVLGDARRVRDALAPDGLSLEERDGYWVIARVGGAAAPDAVGPGGASMPGGTPAPTGTPAPAGVGAMPDLTGDWPDAGSTGSTGSTGAPARP